MNLRDFSQKITKTLDDFIPFKYERYYEDENISMLDEKSLQNPLSLKRIAEKDDTERKVNFHFINISFYTETDEEVEKATDEGIYELITSHPLSLYLDRHCTHKMNQTVIEAFINKDSFTTINDDKFHSKRYQILLNDFDMKLKTVKNKRTINNIQDLNFDIYLMESEYAWYKH